MDGDEDCCNNKETDERVLSGLMVVLLLNPILGDIIVDAEEYIILVRWPPFQNNLSERFGDKGGIIDRIVP